MFSSAMAQSMSQQNPAFSFASGIANGAAGDTMFGAPPPQQLKPTQRQSRVEARNRRSYHHPGNRPDLTAGQEMFRESG
jgi:hypothetical protein